MKQKQKVLILLPTPQIAHAICTVKEIQLIQMMRQTLNQFIICNATKPLLINTSKMEHA